MVGLHRFASIAAFLTLASWIPTPAVPSEAPGDRPFSADGDTRRPVARIHLLGQDPFTEEGLGPLARLGRIGNLIHVETRSSVVRDLLIFAEGDSIDTEMAEEAERVLRRTGLFVDARIDAYARGESLDVVVNTRDAWSTHLQLSFSTAGGGQDVTVGGIESNFLGFGDEVALLGWWTEEDQGQSLRLTKRRFLAPHVRASVAYARGEDSRARSAAIWQPFYSTTAPWSGTLLGRDFTGDVVLFEDGDETGRVRRDQDRAYLDLQGYAGAPGRRWSIGAVLSLDDTRTVPRSGDAAELAARGRGLRDDRQRLVGISTGRVARRFVRVRGVDRAGLREDHALGSRASLVMGVELDELGSTRDRPYLAAGVHLSFAPGPFHVQLGADADARWHDGAPEERQVGAVLKGFHASGGRHVFAFRLTGRLGEDRYADELLYVGAATGLRGFPFRAFRGDRGVVANVEERFYPGIQVSVLDVGFAVFADAGRAWETGDPMRFEDLRADVGLGLRLRNTGLAPLPLRIDVARGLGHDGTFQLSISTGELWSNTARLDFGSPVPTRFGGGVE